VGPGRQSRLDGADGVGGTVGRLELVHVEDHAGGDPGIHGARWRDDLEGRSSWGRGFIAVED